MASSRQRGFTLIELLVVIAVINIAAALIMINLPPTHVTARRTACASNLNQLGKACFMYADEPSNGNLLPTCSTTADPYADKTPMLALNLLYDAYIADSRVFSCPSKPTVASLSGLTPTQNGKLPASGTFLSAQSCSYGYDPGHNNSSPGYDPGHDNGSPMSVIAADKKGTGENSDNHGSSAGQNVLLGNGGVEWMATPIRKLGPDEKGNPRPDDNIYQLDPAQPRNMDGYIRQ